MPQQGILSQLNRGNRVHRLTEYAVPLYTECAVPRHSATTNRQSSYPFSPHLFNANLEPSEE